ncbi:aspartate dehydrogenase [Rhodobacteraceae bacterium RKSG542]|uniref:aspartate dehydrogenase n=1 Tax=Pseudovibrio flavus TaxID=2529854 RepID=UPI0012BD567B|nr:aspartate dehydrogenase [Pseudovibrio flavus]MTI17732.1 aspartate dehydrogenase [Pseudovibrio flavus]
MKLGLIGNGAIAQFVRRALEAHGHEIGAVLLRPARIAQMSPIPNDGPLYVGSVAELPDDLDHVIDCAGHEALRQYGTDVLRAGFDLTTVSIGALADKALEAALEDAALEGDSKLHLASGAIGALDTLRAARVGNLTKVRYTGRKPPKGWLGSPAQESIDLENLGDRPQTHFVGTARQAALEYPKNANVAAAVALSGVGFDETEVVLVADPAISVNIHEIEVTGDFGSFEFRILGNALPDNPRSSALAAMSVVGCVLQETKPIVF